MVPKLPVALLAMAALSYDWHESSFSMKIHIW